MTIQQQGIVSTSAITAGGYSPYVVTGTSSTNCFIAPTPISSLADILTLLSLYTTSQPGTIAIVKLRGAVGSLATYNYVQPAPVDKLISVPVLDTYAVIPVSPIELGPPQRPNWVQLPNLPVDIYTGNGLVIPITTVGTQSVLPVFTLEIRVNYIKIPDPVSIEGLDRETIELERLQKAGIQTQSSQEFSLVLNTFEQGNLSIDNNTNEERKRFARTILGNNKSKDRRTVISSLVNNYSRATKRS